MLLMTVCASSNSPDGTKGHQYRVGREKEQPFIDGLY